MTDRVEPSRRSIGAPLVKKSDPTTIVAWYCTNCGVVYKTKADAERCTGRNRKGEDCTEWSCEICGKPAFAAHQHICWGCYHDRRQARELEKLKTATKVIPANEYPHDKAVVYDSEYYSCLEDFLEYCEEHDIEVPPRVWATETDRFSLNAHEILENAFENWSQGCDNVDMMDICGEDGFVKAVAAFNECQTLCLSEECDTAVELGEE